MSLLVIQNVINNVSNYDEYNASHFSSMLLSNVVVPTFKFRHVSKSPRSGANLRFQLASASASVATGTAAATTIASNVKTVCAKPYIFGTTKV